MPFVKSDRMTTISRTAAVYPALLREIGDPPAELFVRGDPAALTRTLVAIVGTRRATDEGIMFTKLVVESLNCFPEVVTVSGLAFGVDAAVAETAVRGQRPTIAVLASGVDQPTPTSHEKLAADILTAGGCLVSEYPSGTPAHKSRFPARNRIIAGLTRATVVIEAGEPSGALITAYQALEMNRDVFAVPGSPFNTAAAGTNALIKRGAIPLTHPDDLIAYLGLSSARPQPLANTETNETERILQALTTPRTVDQLAEACTIPVARLAALLSVLELAGRIRLLPDQRAIRTDIVSTHPRGQRPRHRRIADQGQNHLPLPREELSG